MNSRERWELALTAASVARASGFMKTAQAFADMAALAAGEHFVARLQAMPALALEQKDQIETATLRAR